ncbi:MAG: efflux RND transporter periplasmic adaptor subunit [Saprospiraceae bacterium]|nr:efflux RND transporter periplasmic adaptor subunit [Lewinella sp.]
MDRIVKEKKGIKLRTILWMGLTAVLLILLYYAFTISKVSSYRIDRELVSIDSVRSGDFLDHLRIPAYVAPISTIYIDAPEGGRIIARYLEEGAMVKQGDAILQLENKEMQQTLMEAEALLNDKKNGYRNSMIRMEQERINLKKELLVQEHDISRQQRYFEQNEILFRDKLIAKEEFIRSREDYEYAVQLKELLLERVRQDSLFRQVEISQLKDNLQMSEKKLQFVKDRINRLKVRVPLAGQLTTLEAEVGQAISSGSRIGQIQIMTDFKIQTEIEEHFIDRISQDLPATLERNGKLYELRIRKIYPEVRDGHFRVDLVFRSERPDNIKIGQRYQLKLELGAPEEAMLLPRGSFFQSTAGQWVYLLHPTASFAVKHRIRIGKQNSQYYEILEGLRPGDRVITSSYDTFGDSERIVLN